MMKMRKIVYVLMLILLSGLTVSVVQAQPPMTTIRPVKIETASVLTKGEWALDAGLAFEFDRELRGREYDNFRLAPFGLRYGVVPSLEIGAFFAYSSNDGEDAGAPDESGLEGISLFGKLELNKFAALRVGLTFGGNDDIFPYPNDGVDLFANLALHRPLGKGLLFGEFGYTAQGGDLDGNQYFNYGIGYAIPAGDKVSLSVELTGEEEHIGNSANTLDVVVGVNVLLAHQLRLAPFVVAGINDAGPDFAFGSFLELRF